MLTEPDKLWRRGPGLGLFTALFLTVVLQAIMVARSPVIAKDGMSFIRIAAELRADWIGAMHVEDQHPGYPAMVLAGYSLTRWLPGISDFEAWILGGRLAAGLAGVVSVVMIWLLTRRIFDRRVADVAALMAAVWPLLRQNASDVLSDTPHMMFYLAGVWLTCEGLARSSVRWFAAACVASGMAYWVRPEGLIVGLTAGVLLLAQLWRYEGQSLTRSLVKVAAVGAVLLAIAAPYGILAGKFTSKKNPFQHEPTALEIAAADIEPTEGLLSEPLPGAKLPDEFTRPASRLGAFAVGCCELGKEVGQGFYYLLLIPLGAWVFAPTRLRADVAASRMTTVLIFCHMGMLVLLFMTAGYVSHRHVMPLIGMMLPATAAGTIWLSERLAAYVPPLHPPRRALTAVMLVILLGLLPKSVRPLHGVYSSLVEAACWIKEHGHPGDSVLATSGYVRFYSEMQGLLLGPEAPNLPIGLVLAPESRPWSYIVLEVDERTFDRAQLCNPEAGYEQVLAIPAHPRRTWSKVLVFSRRATHDERVAVRETEAADKAQ
jgi:hypothetical protein